MFVTNPTLVNILLMSTPAVLSITLIPNVTGVNASESHVGNSSCLLTTITFTGAVALLNGTVITCINGLTTEEDTGTIRVASKHTIPLNWALPILVSPQVLLMLLLL